MERKKLWQDESGAEAKETGELLQENVSHQAKEQPKDTLFGWVITFASFINHCISYGICLSFGVIYVALIEYYGRKRGETAWIGSLQMGCFNILSPLSGLLTEKYGCRAITISGTFLAASGFIGSYFVNDMEYLFVTYGVIVGSGMGLMYLPSRLVTFHYMDRQRSLATGISSAGVGIGTIVFSTVFQFLIDEYGLKGMFLITGGIFLNAAVCGAIFRPVPKIGSKPAVPSSHQGYGRRLKGYFSFVGNTGYIVMLLADILGCVAAYIAFAHLPRMSRDLNLSSWESASLVPIMSGSNIAGRLVFGWVGDFKSVSMLLLWSFSLLICGICLLFCPLLNTFVLLVGFALIYGLFFGVWAGLRPVTLLHIVGNHDLGRALGFTFFLGGFATMAGSPLAGWLYDLTGSYSVSLYNGGSLFVVGGSILLIHRTIHTCRSRKRDKCQERKINLNMDAV